jgi:hypothetical protein
MRFCWFVEFAIIFEFCRLARCALDWWIMSLAALKAELDKKRKANAPSEDATGNKYMRRGDIEKLQNAKRETKVNS